MVLIKRIALLLILTADSSAAIDLGRAFGKATKDGYTYHRKFEHCTVEIDLEKKTSSIEWK